MKRTLQWTTFALACGLLVATIAATRPAQGDTTVAADDTSVPFPHVNVRMADLFPPGR